jgi:hypothetical protein
MDFEHIEPPNAPQLGQDVIVSLLVSGPIASCTKFGLISGYSN